MCRTEDRKSYGIWRTCLSKSCVPLRSIGLRGTFIQRVTSALMWHPFALLQVSSLSVHVHLCHSQPAVLFSVLSCQMVKIDCLLMFSRLISSCVTQACPLLIALWSCKGETRCIFWINIIILYSLLSVCQSLQAV